MSGIDEDQGSDYLKRIYAFTCLAAPVEGSSLATIQTEDITTSRLHLDPSLPPVAEITFYGGGTFEYVYRTTLYKLAVITIAKKRGEFTADNTIPSGFESRPDVQQELGMMLRDATLMFDLRNRALNVSYLSLRHLTPHLVHQVLIEAVHKCLLESSEREVDQARRHGGLPRRKAEERKAKHMELSSLAARVLAGTKQGRPNERDDRTDGEVLKFYEQQRDTLEPIQREHKKEKKNYEQRPHVRRNGFDPEKWKDEWLRISNDSHPEVSQRVREMILGMTAAQVAHELTAETFDRPTSSLEKHLSDARKRAKVASRKASDETSRLVSSDGMNSSHRN